MAGNRAYVQLMTNRLDADVKFTTYNIGVNSAISAGTKWTPVLYADNGSNAPGSLIASGTEQTAVGTETGDLNYSFGSQQTLTAGTKYWFGFLVTGTLNLRESNNSGYSQGTMGWFSATYASGPPATAGAFTVPGNAYAVALNVTAQRGVLGFWDQDPLYNTDYFLGANEMDVISVTTPAGGGTYSATSLSIRLSPTITVGGKMKAIIYTDSSGAPGTLVGTGSEVTVASANQILTSTFSGVNLNANTTYWIGVLTDNASRLASKTANTKWVSRTYTSGPPASFGTPGGTSTRYAGVYLYIQ
jgi:hypothetical protein